MEIHYVLYASRLVAPLGHDGLVDLLETSQRRNGDNVLTGFLHIENEIVLQYLEGPADNVARVMDSIRTDPRHTEFTVLAEDVTDQRFFDGWQMALVESATLSLFDLMGGETRDLATVCKVNPVDLITLLSANASFLRDRPTGT